MLINFQLISKLCRSFEIYWVKQYLVNAVLFGIKYLQIFEITVKLKSNFYAGIMNIFPKIWHCNCLY